MTRGIAWLNSAAMKRPLIVPNAPWKSTRNLPRPGTAKASAWPNSAATKKPWTASNGPLSFTGRFRKSPGSKSWGHSPRSYGGGSYVNRISVFNHHFYSVFGCLFSKVWVSASPVPAVTGTKSINASPMDITSGMHISPLVTAAALRSKLRTGRG